jgi:hypothetical protein
MNSTAFASSIRLTSRASGGPRKGMRPSGAVGPYWRLAYGLPAIRGRARDDDTAHAKSLIVRELRGGGPRPGGAFCRPRSRHGVGVSRQAMA